MSRRRRPWQGIYYGWVLVVTLGITETVTWGILYYSFAVFMPVLETELGWSRGEMSGAFALATLLSGVFAAPVGRWLDFRGPRLLMSAGSIAAVLLVLAWSQVTSLAQFYLLWALIGVTMATVLYEPAFAVVTAWFERKRARAITAVTLVAGFASTIFMPIESWLIEVQGWRTALLTLAGLLAVTTILPHALLLRRRPEDLGLQLDGEPAPAPQPGQAAPQPSLAVGAALRDPSFRWLVVAFALSTRVAFAVHLHLVAYLQDHGYDLTFAATAAGLLGAMQVLGRIVLGLFGDRVAIRVTAAIVLGIQPLALLILLLFPGPLALLGFIVLFGAAKGGLSLIRPSLVVDLYGRARYATIAGVLAAFVTAANALAPISAGAAHDLFGSYDPIFWTFVLLSSISAGAVLLVRRPSRRTQARHLSDAVGAVIRPTDE
jgi:MFS family permease